MKTLPLYLLALGIAACASPQRVADSSDISMDPDDPALPKAVRFEVPTALVVGLPGDREPVTLQARVATHDIAARMLAAHGYCPNGFSGPEGIAFPDRDRARAVFTVYCRPG